MIRADIIITGNVQMVGFRTFLKNLADSLHITGYAKNLEDGSVNVVCEGEKENIEELISKVKEKLPSFADLKDVSMEYSDYVGEFVSFERTNGDVPKDATLGDLLGVMKSFDTKAETLVVILSDMNSTLKSVKEDTSLMAR
jgi:acylphosphatase